MPPTTSREERCRDQASQSSIESNVAWCRSLHEELTANILPFWMTWPVDRNGGFHGAVTNDLEILREVPRSAVLCARILWTFSAAYRAIGSAEYLTTAQWALDALSSVFRDAVHGGVLWEVDADGRPISDRKHNYAQAFAIYGLSEYHRATRDRASLRFAMDLFALIERHGRDPLHGGYIEGRDRTWEPLDDPRLSERDLRAPKSMNTMLHLLEAYTNLLRVREDPVLRGRHREFIDLFLTRIIDPDTGHLGLFFDRSWHSLVGGVSYGHDIEASWLLWEACELHDDPTLHSRVRQAALRLADGAWREGRNPDGSLNTERDAQGHTRPERDWWPQAEAMVGFYNAYQLSGETRYAEASARAWSFAYACLADRTRGEWYKRLHPDGSPDTEAFKAGPWECPYHQTRACLEMIDRLAKHDAFSDTPGDARAGRRP